MGASVETASSLAAPHNQTAYLVGICSRATTEVYSAIGENFAALRHTLRGSIPMLARFAHGNHRR